jgi:hypothetical protein
LIPEVGVQFPPQLFDDLRHKSVGFVVRQRAGSILQLQA